MNSPFPGMDPYLERHWRDVHARLVLYSCDQMQRHLPADLLARVEERIYVEDDHVGNEPVTETFIEIREAGSGNRIITVIEFLSPTNKIPGEGQDLYRQKQKELRQAAVNLVEVDLVRAGASGFSVLAQQVPAHIRTPYKVVVRRGWEPLKAEFYPLPLREKLPGIRIPLRQTDRDVPLNLQAIIEQCYGNGRYETIDYQVEPNPPLTGEDALWADALLRASAPDEIGGRPHSLGRATRSSQA
jgi:hypothetical protein